jgi:hypothetical protein
VKENIRLFIFKRNTDLQYEYDGIIYNEPDLITRIYDESLRYESSLRKDFINDTLISYGIRMDMKKSSERKLAFFFGVGFLLMLMVITLFYPNPTTFQYTFWRIILALAGGGFTAFVPGFLTVEISTWIRAGGALATFAVIYFFEPAKLVANLPQ